MAELSYVTNKGLNIIANRIKGLGSEPLYLGWGTGATPASTTATDISGEATEARGVLTSEIVTVGATGDSYKLSGAMVANAAKTITNWGVFDAASGGNLLLIVSISPGEAYLLGQAGVFYFRIQLLRAS